MQHRFPEYRASSQNKTGAASRTGSRRWLLATAVIVAVAVFAAGCSDGSDPEDGVVAGEDQTTSSADGSSDDGSGSTSTDDGTGSQADDGDGDDGSGPQDSDAPVIPGSCAAEKTNTELFYAVANIADDDPDGGLNVRDNYKGGEKLATLSEGTVVYAEDCYQLEDGNVWFAIHTAEDVNGWVNASFLSPRISPQEPTFGGEETAAKVEAVLNALAAKRWELAADELTSADLDVLPFTPLLGEPATGSAATAEETEGEAEEGPDLAAQLQAYCGIRICDAPYFIVEIRGSYIPELVSPEVDVNFTYSGGIVAQTFAPVSEGGDDFDIDSFTLDTLPGQSILAFNSSRPTVAQLLAGEDARAGLLEAAEAVRRGLLAESGQGIADDYVPDEGVIFSSNAFIAESTSDRQIVTAQDLVSGRDEDRLWGYTDGVGRPIVQTLDEWLAGYRRSIALLEPDEIALNERIGLGNTIDNLASSFPDAVTVEFHRAGRGPLSDFNWSSVRLALELRDREWKVVAITLDTWTV